MNRPKEDVYDAEIAPLMTQIIAICKRAGIPAHAGFALDGDLACTTHVSPARSEIPPNDLPAYTQWCRDYRDALRTVRKDQPLLMITTRDADGNVTSVEAVL